MRGRGTANISLDTQPSADGRLRTSHTAGTCTCLEAGVERPWGPSPESCGPLALPRRRRPRRAGARGGLTGTLPPMCGDEISLVVNPDPVAIQPIHDALDAY